MKKAIIVAIAMAVCVALAGIAVEAQSSPAYKLSDEYYWKAPIVSDRVFFTSRLQQRDYDEVLEELIDSEQKPVSQEKMDEILENDKAYLASNLLSDGRYLVEDWIEKKAEKLLSRIHFATVSKESLSEVTGEDFQISLPGLTGKREINLCQIVIEDKKVVSPRDIGSCSADYIWSSDGSLLFLATDTGLWSVDGETREVKEITVADDKHYAYSKQYCEEKGMYPFTWVGYLYPHPTQNKIAYSSPRDVWPETGNLIYVHDLDSNTISILGQKGVRHQIAGWISADSLLCMFEDDNAKVTFGIVCLDGTITPISLEGNRPEIYGVTEGLFVYAEQLGSPTIHIVSVSAAKTVEELKKESLGDITYLVGNFAFNPSANRCVVLSNPSRFEWKIGVSVWERETNRIKRISAESFTNDETTFIGDFRWLNDNTLCLYVYDSKGNESTWIYEIKGGGQE